MPTALCFDANGTLFDTASVRDRLRERLDAPAGVVDGVVDRWREKQLTYSYQLALMEAYRPFRAVTDAALDHTRSTTTASTPGLSTSTPRSRPTRHWPCTPTSNPRSTGWPGRSTGSPFSRTATPGCSTPSSRPPGSTAGSRRSSARTGSRPTSPPRRCTSAAERLAEPLADCWLVSANGWDAAGAAQAGMGVAWIDRAGDPPERVGGEPDLTVPTLTALVDELE